MEGRKIACEGERKPVIVHSFLLLHQTVIESLLEMAFLCDIHSGAWLHMNIGIVIAAVIFAQLLKA